MLLTLQNPDPSHCSPLCSSCSPKEGPRGRGFEIGKILAEYLSISEVEQLKLTLKKTALKVGADALVLVKESDSTEYVVIPNARYEGTSRLLGTTRTPARALPGL
jgi:hypothetical protein